MEAICTARVPSGLLVPLESDISCGSMLKEKVAATGSSSLQRPSALGHLGSHNRRCWRSRQRCDEVVFLSSCVPEKSHARSWGRGAIYSKEYACSRHDCFTAAAFLGTSTTSLLPLALGLVVADQYILVGRGKCLSCHFYCI